MMYMHLYHIIITMSSTTPAGVYLPIPVAPPYRPAPPTPPDLPALPAPPAIPDFIYEDPIDDPKCYPPQHDAFMKAIQEQGQFNKNKVVEYKTLMKVLAPVQTRLKSAYPNCGIPKNPTDARRALAFACVRIRAHRDTAEVSEEVRKYAVAGSTKVYVIGTGLSVDRAGFRFVLQGLLDYWRSKITTTVTQRSPNDALRLAGIMCDPEERESIQKIMANKKGARAQSDQADDIFTAYFQSIVGKFKSSTYVVDRPTNVEQIKGNESFDANDVSDTLNLIYNLFVSHKAYRLNAMF
jgi:hypothetical protein